MKLKTMKTMILTLILCGTVICAAACNNPAPPAQESQSENQPQSSLTDSSDGQTLSPEQNTEKGPSADSVPLVFTDYSDFLLFGTKGELDSAKYPNAEVILANYQLKREAFVDIKGLFDLTSKASKERSEEIVIENNNEYTYYVYSKDQSDRLKTEYRITVKYNGNSSDTAYKDSIVSIGSISDMQNRTGIFAYRSNGFDVLYSKTETGYKSFTLIGGGLNSGLNIGVFFEGDGLTEAQIASECGSVMSELLAGDTAILNQALDRMNSFVLGSDSKMK